MVNLIQNSLQEHSVVVIDRAAAAAAVVTVFFLAIIAAGSFFLLSNRFSCLLSQAALHDFAHPIEYWFDCWQFLKIDSIPPLLWFFLGMHSVSIQSIFLFLSFPIPQTRTQMDVIIHSFVMAKQLKRRMAKQSIYYCSSTLRFYHVKSSSSNCFLIHTRSVLRS